MQYALDILNELNKIDYGFKDSSGFNLINDEDKWEREFYKFYYLLSPDELLEKKCGVCWDQVELERKLFLDKNIQVETYFIFMDDSKYLPSHTFLTFKDNNKFYWFEHAWYDYKGIHEYDNMESLLNDVKNKFILSKKDEISGKYEVKMFRYNKPRYNITSDEFFQYIYTQEVVEV